MPYYARSAYFPLPSAPQTAAQPPQPQQQPQYCVQAAPVDQVYLRQQAQAQAQAQQLAYQQKQAQLQQQQQYADQQNRQQLAQQQYYQQQQQYAAQQQRQLQQQQAYTQQQQLSYQQQSPSIPSRQQQRSSGYETAPIEQQTAGPVYKSSEYVHAGGVYSTGGAYNQPSLRRVNSRADVNTAIENQEPSYQTFGQGLNQPGVVSQYNPYANYGQAVAQSTQASQLETQVAPLPPRSPARGYSTPQGYDSTTQRGYGGGQTAAESAYISIPNDLVYAQNDQQRANAYAQESRPVYRTSSRTNQTAPSPLKLKPAAARELYAALSSDNIRTALERDTHVIAQAPPVYADYNGQRVAGRAFALPTNQKYSEYNQDDLNNLSVIDR